MWKLLGKLGGAIVGPLLRAATLLLLFSSAFCHAQNYCDNPAYAQPTVTDMTPTTWPAGKTTTVTITGTNLCNAVDYVTVPTGNVTQSEYYSLLTDTELQFTVKPDASDPNETATLEVGLSDGGSFWSWVPVTAQIVNKCTPTITSISPSTWFAGKTYDNVVIKGTGFITTDKATAACPVTPVNITGADGTVVPVSNVNVVDKTKITATIAPDAGTKTEQATVTVGTAPNTGTSASLATPPQVLGNEIHCDPSLNCTQDVISTTDGSNPPVQSVVVGQPIILTTNPNLPATITPYKTTWTVEGTSIGGYAPTTASATVTKTVLNKASLNSYWVYPLNGIHVTYTYCVNIPGVGNQCSEEANAIFNVYGPTATITPSPNNWSVVPPMSCPTTVQLLYFGYPDPTSGCSLTPLVKGISFSAALSNMPAINGSVVSGTAEWVQLITKDTLSGTLLSGGKAGPTSQGVGLDNTYPYKPDDPNAAVTIAASDSPNNSLNPLLSRETRRFKADMYYLWRPQVSGSIFVPLGYVEWSTSGTGVQHTKDSPPWSLALSGPTTAVFKASSDTGNAHGYPDLERSSHE